MKSHAQQILTKENYVEGIINKVFDVAKNTITNIKNVNIAAGAGIEASKLEDIVCCIGSGSYSGNDVTNRAISHGLGKEPKFVSLGTTVGYSFLRILIPGRIDYIDGSPFNHGLSVTQWDSNSFYVGNAGSYSVSGNDSEKVYYWVAYG